MLGVFHAVGLAVGDGDGGVVQEPVQDADRGGSFAQEPAPLFEGPVGGDGQGAAFVGAGDETEQQLGRGVVEWGEAEFVELCRYRHSSTYTDPGTMPMPLFGVSDFLM